MAEIWTPTQIWSTGDVPDAADCNAFIRDNLDYLDRRVSSAFTSTTDVALSGPPTPTTIMSLGTTPYAADYLIVGTGLIEHDESTGDQVDTAISIYDGVVDRWVWYGQEHGGSGVFLLPVSFVTTMALGAGVALSVRGLKFGPGASTAKGTTAAWNVYLFARHL